MTTFIDPKDIKDEATTQKAILSTAKWLGCEMEAKQIMERYYGLLRRCTNPVERRAIAAMGIQELHNLFDKQALQHHDDLVIRPKNDKEKV